MQIVINTTEELINMRKALCVYAKRKRQDAKCIRRLRQAIADGTREETAPPVSEDGKDVDAIRIGMIERREKDAAWADGIIEQINLLTNNA